MSATEVFLAQGIDISESDDLVFHGRANAAWPYAVMTRRECQRHLDERRNRVVVPLPRRSTRMGALDVFAAKGVTVESQYTTYRATLQVRHLLVGGVPASPNTIRNWLRSRMEVRDEALEELVQQTLKERFTDQTPAVDEIITALMEDPDAGLSVNGFKRTPTGELAYETRCLKSAFKEAANSAFPGTDWLGKKESKGVAPRKGLLSTAAERVFVDSLSPDTPWLLPLGVKADEILSNPPEVEGTARGWVEERIKHVMTPQGPKSAINRVEVVYQPVISALIRIHDDFIAPEALARIWARMEDIGIGADRGRSDGSFDLVEWTEIGK